MKRESEWSVRTEEELSLGRGGEWSVGRESEWSFRRRRERGAVRHPGLLRASTAISRSGVYTTETCCTRSIVLYRLICISTRGVRRL